jgi:hypothetical protein
MFQLIQKSTFLLVLLLSVSCSKDEDAITYTKRTIAGKTWYLSNTIEGTQSKSYIDKSTYSIQFKKLDSTIDSDGIIGTYNIIELNQVLQLIVSGKTQSGITANYTYQIDHIEPTSLEISYNQNNLLIRKIFTTTR